MTRLNVLLRLVVYQIPALMLKAGHQHQTALMWSLRNLFTHPYLEAFPSTTRYIFDASIAPALTHDTSMLNEPHPSGFTFQASWTLTRTVLDVYYETKESEVSSRVPTELRMINRALVNVKIGRAHV